MHEKASFSQERASVLENVANAKWTSLIEEMRFAVCRSKVHLENSTLVRFKIKLFFPVRRREKSTQIAQPTEWWLWLLIFGTVCAIDPVTTEQFGREDKPPLLSATEMHTNWMRDHRVVVVYTANNNFALIYRKLWVPSIARKKAVESNLAKYLREYWHFTLRSAGA